MHAIASPSVNSIILIFQTYGSLSPRKWSKSRVANDVKIRNSQLDNPHHEERNND
jgi:hypothetical protein